MPKHQNSEIVRVWHTRHQGTIRRHANGLYRGITCDWYNPCCICYRCDEAAPNIYDRCSECPAVGCDHSVIDRNLMIKRKNKGKSKI